jgi:hypothetical protein
MKFTSFRMEDVNKETGRYADSAGEDCSKMKKRQNDQGINKNASHSSFINLGNTLPISLTCNHYYT